MGRRPVMAIGRGRRLIGLAALCGLLFAGAMTVDRSSAVLTATTPVPANAIASATLLAPTGVDTTSTPTSTTLTWRPSASDWASGYIIYRATAAASGPYTQVATLPGRTTASWADTAPPANVAWYRIAATGYNWTSQQTVESAATLPYTELIERDDPYLWWRMDEAPGAYTALDSSGNNRHGTYTGMSLRQPSALANMYGTSAYSNSSNAKVRATTVPAIRNNFAIEVWVNPSRTHEVDPQSVSRAELWSGNGRYAYAGVPGFNGTQNYIWDPDKRFNHSASNAWINSVAGVSIGTNGVSVYEHTYDWMPATAVWSGNLTGWHYVVINYVNRVPSIYIDGVLVRTGLATGITNVHAPYQLGSQADGYGYYTGYLDEVALYDRSLTPEQIMTHYLSGHNP